MIHPGGSKVENRQEMGISYCRRNHIQESRRRPLVMHWNTWTQMEMDYFAVKESV